VRFNRRSANKQAEAPAAYLSAAIICAARWLDRAAGAAAAAISRTRSRVRCADEGDGRYNHQEIFHSILLLNFGSSRPAKGRADALSDRRARRRNLRTIRTDELADKKPRERLVAGGRVNELHRGSGEDRDADDARCAALLLLIGFWSVLCAIVSCRLCVRLRAAFRFLDLRSCRLHRDDRKQQRRTKNGADYEMQNRSHAINLSLAIRGFNPRPLRLGAAVPTKREQSSW
jgi:hypothetical protein